MTKDCWITQPICVDYSVYFTARDMNFNTILSQFGENLQLNEAIVMMFLS